MQHYQPAIRPRKDSTKPVDVTLRLELHKLQKLEEVDEVLHVSGLVIATWTDDFLQWTPANFGGVDHIIIPASKVWTPDLGLDNGVSYFITSDWVYNFRVSIRYTGEVLWIFGGEFTTSCTLHVTTYPFDKQTCEHLWVSWLHGDNALTLNAGHDVVDLTNYDQHGEWHIATTSVEKIESAKLTDHLKYPRLKITFNFTRKRTFYALNIILPCVFLLILTWLMFWLPCESGEKVSLGITILLAFSVLQLMVADHLPRTSDYIPILSYMLVLISGICTGGVVANIFVLVLHHHGTHSRPPRWIRVIAFKYLAKAFCIQKAVPEVEDSPNTTKVAAIDTENSRTDLVSPPPPTEEKNQIDNGQSNNYMNYLLDKAKAEEEEGAIAAEWQGLAVIVDYIFFIITFLVIIISFAAVVL
ncbi:DgyrCDS3434 [Dimorphilus gyrociliatus]|uniref:DgyrCDS3434 n=1 Tax=Dimorphilus gyrociliatus TaxID=2664684 RepID=A0A7I8VD77_9ANNE|nr:DgyrCDS3434 [Dimorphilus gyrociliatus]